MAETQRVTEAANLLHEYCKKHIGQDECKDCIFGDFEICVLSKASSPSNWYNLSSCSCQAYDIEWDIDIEEGEDYEDILCEYGLPNAVGIPNGIEEKDIPAWLFDEYGYHVKCFRIR